MIPERLKRYVPVRLRSAYHTTRLGLQLLGRLEATSVAALRESAGVLLAILKVKPDSQLDIYGLEQLHRLARAVDQEGVAGDIVECGVYQGGSAALLGYALRRMSGLRHLWLFDSFQGLPSPTTVDGLRAQDRKGTLAGEEARVRQLLHKVRAPADRVHIVPGWFHETFPGTGVDQVALLHIDADWYESVKLCLEHFYDRLEPGGVVVLDDYGVWPGCEAAFQDFLRERALKLELTREGRLPPYFRKPG